MVTTDDKMLLQELKEEIIEALNLEEVTPDDIADDAPLFGAEGLGLDSIDALELTLLLERNYGCKIETSEEGKKILHSVATMAEKIRELQA